VRFADVVVTAASDTGQRAPIPITEPMLATMRPHSLIMDVSITQGDGKTIRQRVKALIDIAHPQFREQLTRRARELHYL
jgi:NAD/NADP transhydrogenase alpha subunit